MATQDDDARRDPEPVEAPPPFLGRWRNVYLLLVGELAALTLLFYALTRYAS